SGQPQTIVATFPTSNKTNAPTNAVVVVPALPAPKTNVPVTAQVPESKPAQVANTNRPDPKPVFTSKKFNWEQVESEDYLKYLDSLRAVGCPEEKIRYIILADVNELCAKRRVQEAVAHDIQWWRAD